MVNFVILNFPKKWCVIFFTGQMKYQYFIEVVPTDIQTLSGTWRTYQYSVKELARPIDHETGSHGAPGIYFRYDMSALKVVVKQDREPFWQWLVKLCAGAGGLISTSTIFCDLLSWLRLMIWPSKAEKLSTTSSTSGSSGTTESQSGNGLWKVCSSLLRKRKWRYFTWKKPRRGGDGINF